MTKYLPLIFTLITPAVSALPIYETVDPGQFFAVDFKFKSDTGNADVLEANGGAISKGLLGSNIELFVNNKGSSDNSVELPILS